MNKNTLVTGGAGFIGSHVAEALLMKKRHVRILIRRREYSVIEKDTLNTLQQLGGEIVYGDLRDISTLKPAVKGIDSIFHLGAVSRPMKILNREYYENSAYGTKNILLAARHAGIKKFVHVSTVSVLGVSPNGHSLTEDDYQPTDMQYATSKLIGEKLALEYCRRFNIPVVVVRPCLTYGPRCLVRLVMFKFVKKGLFPIFRQGKAKMEFLYVDNVVSALLMAEKYNHVDGEIFNITDGQPYEIGEVLSTIASELNCPPPRIAIPTALGTGLGYVSEFISSFAGIYPPFSRSAADWMSNSRNVYDCSKAKISLKYKPEISLREGIRRTVAWYRKYGLI